MIEIIKDYHEQVPRTFVDLGNDELNETHCILGFITEFGELSDPYKKKLAYKKELDLVNVAEEWADFGWYLAAYVQLGFYDIEKYYKLLENQNDIEINDFFNNMIIDDLNPNHRVYAILTTFPVVLNSLLTVDDEETLVLFTNWWWTLGNELGINKEKALSNNLAKLKARYPDKFTTENALNRDLNKERNILEN